MNKPAIIVLTLLFGLVLATHAIGHEDVAIIEANPLPSTFLTVTYLGDVEKAKDCLQEYTNLVPGLTTYQETITLTKGKESVVFDIKNYTVNDIDSFNKLGASIDGQGLNFKILKSGKSISLFVTSP